MNHTHIKILFFTLIVCTQAIAGESNNLNIVSSDFRCIREMTPIRHFYVDNIIGPESLKLTILAANNTSGETYPAGSVIQLVPTEVMVKRNKGFSPVTNDWEFFEFDVSSQGTNFRARGFVDVKNKFGGNCFSCHVKAESKWDMICETGHGCDPIPLTHVMTRAIQKMDPRCLFPEELTTEETVSLKKLNDFMQN